LLDAVKGILKNYLRQGISLEEAKEIIGQALQCVFWRSVNTDSD